MSDDGAHGVTLIAFLGSVFSPYYAWARHRGSVDPLRHCAVNVALYGRRGGRWAMTERAAHQIERSADTLVIGRSSLSWTGDTLEMSIDERCAPIPRRLRGTIRLTPHARYDRSYQLGGVAPKGVAMPPAATSGGGRHRWTPLAPCAHIEVAFAEPALRWSGVGYLDSNDGDEPLENAFADWSWSRAGAAHDTVVLYDTHTRRGAAHSLALKFLSDGRTLELEPPATLELPRTGWRMARPTRVDSGSAARVIETLEDAPFYSRTLIDTCLYGRRMPAIHESLDLTRFAKPWVQMMLPFRMPRIAF